MPSVENNQMLWNEETQSWSIDGFTIPAPKGLLRFDHAKREINASIVVVGAGADRYLQFLFESTSTRGALVDLGARDEATFSYLPVRLGDIRGFKTVFHLYGCRSDPRLMKLLFDDLLPSADAIIFASPIDHDQVVDQAAARLKALGRSAPVAVLAPSRIENDWATAIGQSPAFLGAMTDDDIRQSLKVVAKAILLNFSDGQPEVEPAVEPRQEPKPHVAKPWWKFW